MRVHMMPTIFMFNLLTAGVSLVELYRNAKDRQTSNQTQNKTVQASSEILPFLSLIASTSGLMHLSGGYYSLADAWVCGAAWSFLAAGTINAVSFLYQTIVGSKIEPKSEIQQTISKKSYKSRLPTRPQGLGKLAKA